METETRVIYRLRMFCMKKNEIFTIPNLLTLIRLACIWPAIYYLNTGETVTAVLFVAIAAVTDSADGYIARRFNQVSDIGKAFDPVVDKLFILSIVMFMVVSPDFRMPLGFLIFITARELLLMLGGLYAIAVKKIVLQAEKPGKYSAFFNGVAVVSYMINFTYAPVLMGIAVLFTLYSTWVYVQKFFLAIKKAEA